MDKTKRQQAVDATMQAITGGSQAPAKGVKTNPLGVLLEADEIAQLDRAAADLGVSRHAILQYAVKQFLAGWARGDRPELGTKTTKVLKVK